MISYLLIEQARQRQQDLIRSSGSRRHPGSGSYGKRPSFVIRIGSLLESTGHLLQGK